VTSSFRVVGQSSVATGGFLRLEGLRIQGPDGAVHERFVVRHPGAVVVVPFDETDGNVLMIRQYRVAVDAELLEVPAGKRDVAGEVPEATGRRELEEEVGHRAQRMVALAEFFNTPGFCTSRSGSSRSRSATPRRPRSTRCRSNASPSMPRWP